MSVFVRLSALRLIRHWVNWDLCVCVCWGWCCCLLVSGLCCRIIQRLSLSHPPSIAADQLGVKSGWIICAAAALIKQQLMDWGCCDHKTQGKVHHYHRSFFHYQLIIDHSWLIILQYKQSRIYQELLTTPLISMVPLAADKNWISTIETLW